MIFILSPDSSLLSRTWCTISSCCGVDKRGTIGQGAHMVTYQRGRQFSIRTQTQTPLIGANLRLRMMKSTGSRKKFFPSQGSDRSIEKSRQYVVEKIGKIFFRISVLGKNFSGQRSAAQRAGITILRFTASTSPTTGAGRSVSCSSSSLNNCECVERE